MANEHIVETGDGSHSIYLPELDEYYHSRHGAIQESRHVFIGAGLHYAFDKFERVNILEVGFGTGLNGLLTIMENEKLQIPIVYTGIEKYPLQADVLKQLNYAQILGQQELFEHLHAVDWEKDVVISQRFTLHKTQFDLLTQQPTAGNYQLIYYDAFGPRVQPEMWTVEVLQKIVNALVPGGVLVTYCCKGDVRRAMQAAGLRVEKLPGPPGKREMVRAYRDE